MLLALGEQVQITLVGAFGAATVALITGWFAYRAARTTRTVSETGTAMSVVDRKVEGWEELFDQYRNRNAELVATVADRDNEIRGLRRELIACQNEHHA